MAIRPFGNDPEKIERYRSFWRLAPARRPLTGFTFAGWFPLRDFAACRAWQSSKYLEPGMIRPQEFMADHIRLLHEGEFMDDDMIRGVCPGQLAFPWLSGMLGCRTRILPETVVGEESHQDWSCLSELWLHPESDWYKKYFEYSDLLVETAEGRFPVSHSAEIGPTDLHALLRGHSRSLLDLVDEPELSAALLARLGDVCREFFQGVWARLPLYCNGYFDAQYSLWAPGPIIRMQEDATAVYSPALYRRFVQPVDRALAGHFPCSMIHLHSTSMFLLDAFLEIDEIRCFEVNHDAVGPELRAFIPHLQKVQRYRRPLLIRGAFTAEELRLLMDNLDPSGLFLNIMVSSTSEVELLRPIAGL